MIKVLVLDDDADLLEMVEIVLTHHKMNVFPIKHSNELFDSINKIEPDIILMDIYLGEEDGRALCRQLKTSEEHGHVPVILYSAGDISDNSVEESMANEFIPKPFDINLLVNKIWQCHSGKR